MTVVIISRLTCQAPLAKNHSYKHTLSHEEYTKSDLRCGAFFLRIHVEILYTQRQGKCSKISNTFLFLFSYKIVIFRAIIYKMLVKIANREDLYQTASSKAV